MNADTSKGLISQSNPVAPGNSQKAVEPKKTRLRKIKPDHWPILLVEFIHLLGLFLIHTRHAKSARATKVLFDQLVRHLNVLSKLPDHDGAMIIRRVRESEKIDGKTPNYIILFGNITLRGDSTWDEARYGQSRITQFGSALQKAFNSLEAQGIHALFLKLPEQSAENIERLRLTLNIIARFRQAAVSATPITFRYFGRTLTIPLIRDQKGSGDINLTLMAGLNNLSAANTMEMIKQAEAYSKLGLSEDASSQPVNWYNLIFCEPRLRRHLVWPPVEVNNLPWADPVSDYVEEIITLRDIVGPSDSDEEIETAPVYTSYRTTVDRSLLYGHLKDADRKTLSAVDILLTEDYPVLNPRQLGARVGAISFVLDALEARSVDPPVLESLMAYLNARLEWVPDSVLSSLHIQRKGLRIGSGSSALLVGMVHPRLLDLVSLIKERLATRMKMKAVQALTLGFKPNETAGIGESFNIDSSDAEPIFGMLHECFDDQGRFHPDDFEAQIDQVIPHGAPVFEVLWCLFKQTADSKGRGDLLRAIQCLIERLDSTRHALKFLLSDIFQNPFEVKHMDRRAIVLANVLLCADRSQVKIDMQKTSESVLEGQHGIDSRIQEYAVQCLDDDRLRISTKLRTICELLHHPAGHSDQGQRILFDHSFLTALEKEVIIFLSLVGGNTSRIILMEALESYALVFKDCSEQPQEDLASQPVPNTAMAVDQMVVLIRALGRTGRAEDIEDLETFNNWIVQLESREDETVKAFIPTLKKELSHAIKAIQHGEK